MDPIFIQLAAFVNSERTKLFAEYVSAYQSLKGKDWDTARVKLTQLYRIMRKTVILYFDDPRFNVDEFEAACRWDECVGPEDMPKRDFR